MKMFQQKFHEKKIKIFKQGKDDNCLIGQIFDFGILVLYLVVMICFKLNKRWAKKRPGLGGGRHDTEVRVAKV